MDFYLFNFILQLSEFFNMINVIPDERFLLRAYVLDNIMGSSLDIFKASSQV